MAISSVRFAVGSLSSWGKVESFSSSNLAFAQKSISRIGNEVGKNGGASFIFKPLWGLSHKTFLGHGSFTSKVNGLCVFSTASSPSPWPVGYAFRHKTEIAEGLEDYLEFRICASFLRPYFAGFWFRDLIIKDLAEAFCYSTYTHETISKEVSSILGKYLVESEDPSAFKVFCSLLTEGIVLDCSICCLDKIKV